MDSESSKVEFAPKRGIFVKSEAQKIFNPELIFC